jgi:hypothetical protein
MTLSITTILYGYNSVGLGVIGTASSDSLILTVVTNRTPTATVETIVGLPSISVFYSTRYFTGTKGITTSRTVSLTSTLTSWIGEPISVPSVFQSIQISGTSSSTQGLTLGFPTTSSSTQGLALGSPTTSSSNSSAFSSLAPSSLRSSSLYCRRLPRNPRSFLPYPSPSPQTYCRQHRNLSHRVERIPKAGAGGYNRQSQF